MALYNANGQIALTQVNGSSYTGRQAADGSWNIVINDGVTGGYRGLMHPCGAINAVVVTDASASFYAANGSMNVISNAFGGYSSIQPQGTGFSAVAPNHLLGADTNRLLGADGSLLTGF